MTPRRLTVLLLALPLAALLAWSAGVGLRSPDPAPPPGPAGPALFRILGPDERPVAGARVALWAEEPARAEPVRLAEVVSDPDGGVRPESGTPAGGRPVLVVRAARYAPAVFRPEPGERDLHLSAGRPVSGVVHDLFGRPLPGARVLCPDSPPFVAEARVGEDGRFDLGAQADDARIRAEAPGRAPLDVSAALFPDAPDSITITLAPGHRVAGRVVDTRGEPVPGAVVELVQESRTLVTADLDGRFRIDGVLPDWEVVLTPLAAGLLGEPANVFCGEEAVTLVLARPAEVSGTVVDGRSGFPVESFSIRRHPAEVRTGGRFRIGGLLPGPIRIEAASGTLSGSLSLHVAEGEVREGLRVALYPPRWAPPGPVRAAWPVAVRAVSADGGEPLPGVRVAYPESGDEARTGPDGRLTVFLPAGRRRLVLGGTLEDRATEAVVVEVPREEELPVPLRANPPADLRLGGAGEGADARAWFRADGAVLERAVTGGRLRFPAARGVPFDLWVLAEGCLPGARTGEAVPEDGEIAVTLARGAWVTGRAVETAGRPLARVGIELAALPPQARVETPGDGTFRVGPVEPGPHRALVNARNVRTRRLALEVPPEGLDLGDVAMSGPAELRIAVLTTGGEPIPGAFVTTTFRVAAKGVTDGDGRISLPGTEPEEALQARAEGYLDGWVEIRVPEGEVVQDVTIRLSRPGRLLVRVVDSTGRPRPVAVPAREDFDAALLRPGELLLTRLAPGELVLDLEDPDGRRGTLRTDVREGEDGVRTVVLR